MDQSEPPVTRVTLFIEQNEENADQYRVVVTTLENAVVVGKAESSWHTRENAEKLATAMAQRLNDKLAATGDVIQPGDEKFAAPSKEEKVALDKALAPWNAPNLN